MRLEGSGTNGTSNAKEILAQGEADEMRYKAVATGAAVLVLCVGGIGTIWFQPTIAKDVWLFLGPVITGGFAYLMGSHRKTS